MMLITFSTGLVPSLAAGQDASGGSILLGRKGSVQHASRNGPWIEAAKGQGLRDNDRIRTVRLENGSILRMAQLTTIDILPAQTEESTATLSILQGLLYFFSRAEPEEIVILTPPATGAIKGAEFDIRVAADGTTDLTVVDGVVTLSNEQGSVTLNSGEAGHVLRRSTPKKTAVIDAFNRVQWVLYYPAVFDTEELQLSPEETAALSPALEHYRHGDLVRSFANLNLSESGAELKSADSWSFVANRGLAGCRTLSASC